ncbi:uncharacterized protein FFMR_05516 [Fusarium fujikuroi]|nr:uncharacterized protein FFMR_05516 [Fusarium fujikuroi]
MADNQSIQFPSLGDSSLPSSEQDKQLLGRLKSAWDQYSDKWDNETKREYIGYILDGKTKITKINKDQPSGYRLWKANDITFATWLIFWVTYDDDKLTKLKEWLRTKFKNIDPYSWISPNFKRPKKSKSRIGSSSKTQALPPPPQSNDPMNISDDDDDDVMTIDAPENLQNAFQAINAPKVAEGAERKRSFSAANETLADIVRQHTFDTSQLAESATSAETPRRSIAPAPGPVLTPNRHLFGQGRTPFQEKLAQKRSRNIAHSQGQVQQNLIQSGVAFQRPATDPPQGSPPRFPSLGTVEQTAHHHPAPQPVYHQPATQPGYHQPTTQSATQSTPPSIFGQPAEGRHIFNPSIPRSDQSVTRRSSAMTGDIATSPYGKTDDAMSDTSDPMGSQGSSGHRSSSFSGVRKAKWQTPGNADKSVPTQHPLSSQTKDESPTVVAQRSRDPFVSSPGSSHGKSRKSNLFQSNNRETDGRRLMATGESIAQDSSDNGHLSGEPLWFQSFRREYFSQQKQRELCEEIGDRVALKIKGQIADKVTTEIKGLILQAVKEVTAPIGDSLIKCIEAIARHYNTSANIT